MTGRRRNGRIVMALFAQGAVLLFLGAGVASSQDDSGITVEWYSLIAYPEANCTKLHVYVKNTGPASVLLQGIRVGDKHLNLGISDDASAPEVPQNSGKDLSRNHTTQQRAENQAPGSLQWHRALPNPVEPGRISEVTVSLWGSVLEVPVQLLADGGRELAWDAREEKQTLRLSHVAFDPSDPRKAYVYVENTTEHPVAISGITIDTERATVVRSIPDGRRIAANGKSCFIVRARQDLSWGDYCAATAVGDGGERATAVLRVMNFFPVSSWRNDTRAELFFDPRDFRKAPPATLKRKNPTPPDSPPPSAAPADNHPREAYYDGIDVTCAGNGLDGWHDSVNRLITVMERLRRLDPRTPYYTIVCDEGETAYGFFGDLPDMACITCFTNLFRPYGPDESARRIAAARRYADPRPVLSAPEAFAPPANRIPSPEEMSYALWGDVAQGAKGIRYYIRRGENGARGYAEMPGLETRIAFDNLDLQLLKHFLRIGDAFDLCASDDPELTVGSILCGDRGAVVIVLNRNFRWHKDVATRWTPAESGDLMLRLPAGLKPARLFAVDHGFKSIPCEIAEQTVTFAPGSVPLVRVFLLAFEEAEPVPPGDGGLTKGSRDALDGIENAAKNFQEQAVSVLNASLWSEVLPDDESQVIVVGERIRALWEAAVRRAETAHALRLRSGQVSALDAWALSLSGRLALDDGSGAEALGEQGLAAAREEDLPRMCAALFHMFGSCGRTWQAARILAAAFQRVSSPSARSILADQLARFHEESRDYEGAAGWTERLLDSGTMSVEQRDSLQVRAATLRLLHANRLVEEGKPQEAIQVVDALSASYASTLPTDYVLGQAHRALGDREAALRHLRIAAEPSRPFADQAQYLIGMLMMDQQRFEEAANEFRDLVERFPGSPSAEQAKEMIGRLGTPKTTGASRQGTPSSERGSDG